MRAGSMMSLHPTPDPTPTPRGNICDRLQENAHLAAFTLGQAIFEPTQTQEAIYVTGAQENARFAAFTVAETQLHARRYVRLEPKTRLNFQG